MGEEPDCFNYMRDEFPNLMELRFANDILLFPNSGPEAAQLLQKLIIAVRRMLTIG